MRHLPSQDASKVPQSLFEVDVLMLTLFVIGFFLAIRSKVRNTFALLAPTSYQ